MRHLTAAQMREGYRAVDGGGWHYVSLSRRGGYPLGYCAEHEPHATEDEARACYRRWQRDQVELREDALSWTSCSVQDCDEPARHAAEVRGDGYALAPLCDEHLTIEQATTALGLDGDLAGDAWRS